MKALLPELNSPTTTSRKSSSSWRIDDSERRLVRRGRAEVGQRVPDRGEQFAGLAQADWSSAGSRTRSM